MTITRKALTIFEALGAQEDMVNQFAKLGFLSEKRGGISGAITHYMKNRGTKRREWPESKPTSRVWTRLVIKLRCVQQP